MKRWMKRKGVNMARRYNWQSAMKCAKLLSCGNGFYSKLYDDLYNSKEKRKALDDWIKANGIKNDSDFVLRYEN